MRQHIETTAQLTLDDVSLDTWSAFQAGDDAGVPPALASTWERSRALGALSHGVPASELLLRGAELDARIERLERALVHLPAVLAQSGAHEALRDFTLLVADLDGVVLRSFGGGGFAGEAQRVRLIEGACWSEAMRGTNAIGTAAAENAPVTVTGHAHYGADFHGLVCYGVPVHAPDHTLIGVLDATSFLRLANPSAADAVLAAARAWERLLRVEAYLDARFSPDVLEQRANPAFLIEPNGSILRGNSAARGLISAWPVDLAGVFGVDWSCFEDVARMRSDDVIVELGPRGASHRMQLEPVVATDGNVIALIAELTEVRRHAPRAPRRVDAFDRLYASDVATRTAIDWARRIARSELAVIVLGETGSGKELIAQAIHAESKRASGPFIAVNCGAIAPQLLESELFGYAPGAFTGAERQGRHGLLHAAGGGTLFLDEVADMPPAMQVALLRVLETNTYRRVGEAESRTADVRLVCATCRDLSALVESGAFRRDLYFRLKGATVTLPALRQRSDVPQLARHLLDELSRRAGRPAPALSTELAAWLCEQEWPGNVRELKSVLEVALVLAEDAPVLQLGFLPPDLTAQAPATAPTPLDDIEASAVRRTLAETNGNISATAEKLGVARSTVYRMMRRHGLLGPPNKRDRSS